MSVIAGIAFVVFLVYFFIMWARFALDLLRTVARNWRPKGIILVFSELVMTLTDPPLKLVRRVIPPIRMGIAALDISWSVVMLVVIVLMYAALALS